MIAKVSAGFGALGFGFGLMPLTALPGPGLLLPL
jgi:hypothetical protein